MVSMGYLQAGWSRPAGPDACSAGLEVFTMNGLDCRPSKRFRWTPPQEKYTPNKQYSSGISTSPTVSMAKSKPTTLFFVTMRKPLATTPRQTIPRNKVRGRRQTRGRVTSGRQSGNYTPGHVSYPSNLAMPTTLHRYSNEYPAKRAKQEKNERDTLDDWMSTLFSALDRVPRTAGVSVRPCGIAYLVRRAS